MAMLEVRDLRKSFYTYAKPGLQAGIFHKPGARKVVSQLDVLKGVDLTVNKGDVVAILGPSGSGKTTFLRCLNFLETTDSGTLIFDGEQFDLGKITKADIARLRKKTAFVFQNYNLFRNKTALQNVTEGLVIARKMPKAQADAIGMKMLEKVGLADRADSYPRQLRPDRLAGPRPRRCSVRRFFFCACTRRDDGPHRHGQQPDGRRYRRLRCRCCTGQRLNHFLSSAEGAACKRAAPFLC